MQRRSSLSAYLGAKPQPPTEAEVDPVKLAQVRSAAAMDQLSTSLNQGVAAYDPTRR